MNAATLLVATKSARISERAVVLIICREITLNCSDSGRRADNVVMM